MKFKEEGILLSAESKPYEFDGNKGTTHLVRVSIAGEIYPCKSTPEQVQSLQDKVGDPGEVTLELVSRKERISLKLVSFVSE